MSSFGFFFLIIKRLYSKKQSASKVKVSFKKALDFGKTSSNGGQCFSFGLCGIIWVTRRLKPMKYARI